MTLTDLHGLPLSGADQTSADAYLRGLHELRCFIGDPVGSANAAIAEAPDFVMAHVLRGYLYGLSTEREAMAVAQQCHAAAVKLLATQGEAAHVTALGHLAHGRWHDAGDTLASLSRDEPLDALALQAGHQIDFFTGNATMLRDRLARALPEWDAAMPGYHAMLGMQAFGLEEMGDYANGERLGRQAIELEPRDGWAQHAVAHVMEMQCRQRDGIAWMRANPENWTRDSFLQTHNWWHLALFHYDLGEIGEVLALYDAHIGGTGSTLALNLVDASAILWRLHIGGHDIGNRWRELAERWALKSAGNYAFNDMHAMMAFVGSGRSDLASRLLDAQRGAMEAQDDNAGFTRDIGHPLALAMLRFADGDYAEVVRLIQPVRAIAHRFGGSHAQRDVIDLTLIEAAIRAGDVEVAGKLTAARLRERPDSVLAGYLAGKAGAGE